LSAALGKVFLLPIFPQAEKQRATIINGTTEANASLGFRILNF
jgi:hypothetical protein